LARPGGNPSAFGSFSCEDVDECVNGTDRCDRERGRCINTIGGYQCQCISPFFGGDGFRCAMAPPSPPPTPPPPPQPPQAPPSPPSPPSAKACLPVLNSDI
jgi:hypothetical protein